METNPYDYDITVPWIPQQNQLYEEQLDELKKRVNTVEDLSKELSMVAGKINKNGTESAAMAAIGGPGPVALPRRV